VVGEKEFGQLVADPLGRDDPRVVAISVIAASTSGAGTTPSWATKRAARIIRSGSSPKDTSGAGRAQGALE
jgi:hypothetical protein